MKSDAKRHRIRLRATAIARALVATTVALSFVAMLVTIRVTSTSDMGAMPCCAGHAGSCPTGLLQSSKITNLGEVVAGVHGSNVTQAAGETFDTIESAQFETRSTATEDARLAAAYALRKPCPPECGMCSVTYTWRSRHREQSALGLMAKPQPPSIHSFFVTDYACIKKQTPTYSQLRARAPPSVPA